MLKAKEMVRVLIAGPLDLLPRTIEILYELEALHLVEHRGEDETFALGKPLEKATEVSESLVKLRSIASVLEVEMGRTPPRAEAGTDAEQRILTLEVNIREEEETRMRIGELLSELKGKIEALEPFAALGLDLRYYRGYENLAVFVGRLPGDLEDVEEVTEDYEVFRQGENLALFAGTNRAEEVLEFLLGRGFSSLDIPEGEGDPRARLRDLLAERSDWETRLEAVHDRLTTLRERYADFVVSAEAFLTREIEKAEAPLMFAASDHSFVAEGWVPLHRWPEIQDRLGSLEALYVDLQNPPREDEPPVLLDNPKPARSFEFLTNLFSTPRYGEIDPTVALFVIFPVFFGFMIGDVGYGSLFVILGLVALWKIRPPSDFRNLMAVVLFGGIFAMLFGAFVFAEAFGIPFHPPSAVPGGGAQPVSAEEEVLSWETFGLRIPLDARIHKLTDIVDLLILSLIAGALHLGLGYGIGIANEIHHSRRHAVVKAAWLMVLFGLFLVILHRVAWNRIARFLWETILAPVPRAGIEIFGIQVPWVALGLLLGGTTLLVVLEAFQKPLNIAGFLAPIEVAGLLANMISYTRLAGIGIAKAAMAEALNTVIFGGLIFAGGLALVIVGFAVLLLAQMLVFFLGAISAGIQALRLNYVEFFTKFFNGNGVPFKPFGARSIETA